jgi:predicted amidophosphoribosyltransferase
MTRRHEIRARRVIVGGMSFMTELRHVVGSAADRALDFTMPATCVGCYREGTTLCRDCRMALGSRLGPSSNVVAAHGELLAPLARLESCAPFAGITRRAIDRLSAAGERRLSGPLGEAIATRWRTAGSGGDVLVPVPDSSASVRARGYDEAVLLARVAGRRLRLPVVEALGRASEAEASGTVFDVIAPELIVGRSVVLIDDVVTTGATLVACATALLKAGARVVSAVTVASDRGRTTAPQLARAVN